jgi:3-hydroxybutyryl-CoA dehydrogenase
VNRLLVPYLLDAIRAYEEGVGSIEDIDNAM